jgi:hypothetical protein
MLATDHLLVTTYLFNELCWEVLRQIIPQLLLLRMVACEEEQPVAACRYSVC